ncbi:transposable element Tcb2 transposase [Trichonephila clavipes]|nr:transposable element Tcb2 transposase [Trichonephila clavipes]
MDDNARPHRTLAVEELLESEDITRMDWPAYSPDLNPIEHVWDTLGRRIAARLHHLENTQQLELIEEWALLPQEMLHQLGLSMRRRCEATIACGMQCRFKLISGLGRRRSTGPLGTGGSKEGLLDPVKSNLSRPFRAYHPKRPEVD